MAQKELADKIYDLVKEYIENFDRFDSNPQIRVNPDSLQVELVNGSDFRAEIEDSDEAVENAAIAQGMETQESSEYQVKQNPDFYSVKKLLKAAGDTDVPDKDAIAEIVTTYF